jgi:hypothetical protein
MSSYLYLTYIVKYILIDESLKLIFILKVFNVY